MAEKLISITDENKILITAQFIIEAEKKKTEPITCTPYDIDLIVDNSITCNELMDAIKFGLNKKNKLHQDVSETAVSTVHYDSRVVGSNINKNITEEIPDSEEDVIPICLRVYNDCMAVYSEMQNIPDNPNKLFVSRIGRGSIDYHVLTAGEAKSFSSIDQIWLIKCMHGDKTLKELGFMTTSRLVFDSFSWHRSAILFSSETVCKSFQDETPHYNISDNPLSKLDDEPINIIPPTDIPKMKMRNLIVSVMTPLLMMGAVLFSSFLLNFNSPGMIYMRVIMAIVFIASAVFNYYVQKSEHKKEIKEWKEHYEEYVKQLLENIRKKQFLDVIQLQKLYPAKTSGSVRKSEAGLIEMASRVDGTIFSRRKEHPDFLTIRLGLSAPGSRLVESVFPIKGEKKDVVFSSVRYKNIENEAKKPFSILLPKSDSFDENEPYLTELPYNISQRYAYLSDAPVLLHLKECGCLGIVFPEDKQFQPFLENVLLDMCYYQAPDDLQCIWFCPQIDNWVKQQKYIRKYKHLPHFRELLGDLSAFAFCESNAALILNRLLEVLNNRKNAEEGTRFPHIVMIIEEEYSFKRHPVAEYLPESISDINKTNCEISFIFCKRYKEHLPKYCGQVIVAEKTDEDEKWCLLSHNRIIYRQNIENIKWDEYEKKFRFRQNNDDNSQYFQYSFFPDADPPAEGNLDEREIIDEYFRAFKCLSALYYDRIAQSSDVPSRVDLFDLFDVYEEDKETLSENDNISASGSSNKSVNAEASALLSEEHADNNNRHSVLTEQIVLVTGSSDFSMIDGDESDLKKDNKEKYKKKLEESLVSFIRKQWDKNKSEWLEDRKGKSKKLAVPIGEKAGHEKNDRIVYLDLNEKEDGPHMLVAGTTGSGKTETILSFLIGLCTLYSPEQVNLLLVDMKAGEFAKRIESLPHVVGTVTDVDGDENGTGSAYMLQRFLRSMTAEKTRRKLLLNKMGVDSLDKYIDAKANPQEHIDNLQHSSGSCKENRVTSVEDIKKLPVLAHLFLVVDEFTELMRFSADNGNIDFKEAITSLARVGRSFGFHIILVSQNIENAITPDIRVNSRARLCLKVATREASKEMIGTDLAASPLMPGNGRAYLLVGTGSRFEYFQSAYSGDDIARDIAQPIQVVHAATNGKYYNFYDSYEDNDDIKKSNKANKLGMSQLGILVNQIIECAEQDTSLEKPKLVFQKPLPAICYFEYDWSADSDTDWEKDEYDWKTNKGRVVELKM